MCCTSHEGDRVRSGSEKTHAVAGLSPEAVHTDCINNKAAEIGDEAHNLQTSRFDVLAGCSPL